MDDQIRPRTDSAETDSADRFSWETGPVNGAGAMVQTLAAGGVEVCFANPGTSEMHIVAALDRSPGIRSILCLFEGVATGAADGYARMTGKPGSTLLHLAPGLANGIAGLHNASRAQVPMINIIGDHPAAHRRHTTPLAADIEALARPYSQWMRTSANAANLAGDTADAIAAARSGPGHIATLIVPSDVAWGEAAAFAMPRAIRGPPRPLQTVIENVARTLRSSPRAALLLCGAGLKGEPLLAAGRVAAATGAELLAPFPLTRIERGAGCVAVRRLPYVREQAMAVLAGFRHLILVGAEPPVAYFAYPGIDSVLTPPDCGLVTLAGPDEDCEWALHALVDALSAGAAPLRLQPHTRLLPPTARGTIYPPELAIAIAAAMPENAIVVDEGMTAGRAIMTACEGARQHDWLGNTGGAIGTALPLAVGAAVACPDRRVLCISADGSGMFAPQALWTMAREQLDVTVVILANRAYAILEHEYHRIIGGSPGSCARDLFAVDRPSLDWVALGNAMGLAAIRVVTLEELSWALMASLESPGPGLIEIRI